MRCNGLPNAYDPGDLRKYLHMWKLQNENLNKLEINWLINIDERTILTQDQSKIDLTRNNLKAQQPILGNAYSKRIREILGILTEIDEAIIFSGLSKGIIKDLHVLKLTFRTSISEYIDDFTFKILSNIERDMELSKGGTVATHAYQSDVFKSQIWTLREVPQPQLNPKEKAKLEKSHTEIEFPLLELEITLPPSIKCKDSAIRVLWLSYDHFSDYCPSYEIPVKVDETIDIGKATRREWRKRKEIIKSAKENTDGGKANKNDAIIDVTKMYTEYEDELSKTERRQKGPEGLKLSEFDVNLRKYRMVGGVYCIEYVKQPQQDIKLNPKKYLRTGGIKWFLELYPRLKRCFKMYPISVFYPNSLQRKYFHQTYKPPAPVLPGVRRLPEEIEAEMREMEANLDKLASATIKLPEDSIMWFEPPTVCRWEWPKETQYSEGKRMVKKSKISTKKKSSKPPLVIEDFNLFSIPSGLDMYCIMQEFVVPRLPNGYSIKIDRVLGDHRRSSLLRNIRKDSKEPPTMTTRPSSVNIKHALVETNSPRPLFPKITIKRELHVVEKIDRSSSIVTDCSIENENSLKRPNELVMKKYMFSKLLKDLDELNELQHPYPEKQMEEISESLSMSVEEEEVETEPDFTSISFLRTNDFPWIFNKKTEKNDEQPPEEESEDSSVVEDAETDSSDDEIQTVGKWSTRDVHDAKFNEDKLAIQFKIGRLGCFGLAINWYSNLPFQTWELKPDIKSTTPNTIIFSLSASVVSIELSLMKNKIILNSFQGGTSTIIQDVIGKAMSFDDLKNIFTSAGVNLFPENDAFCYAEGTCEKHLVMESHLYDCMAAIALTHNFTWSRWNFQSGRRSCVVLMREIIENRKTPNHSTLLVTPLKASIIDCTDVSPCFNPVGVEGMEFYADLHQLSKAHSQAVSLMKQAQMDPHLRNNVKKILKATRPLSFC
ncbi:Dynein axonemal intermediate chain 7 like [Pseudolycoriella hygida]|uniref:Dynein axonemal intermediate chain 7 like n=1 Tax=Pseudolycoriella hygida TaxID=35572 RepID=A0A9Q0RT68_9DIPT|nr:Dynein axonemal intermediate chain 7 like [Pseudolycoriella hygida]